MQQDQILVIAAVVAVIVLALVIWSVLRKRRTDALRDRFGDEYDRTLDDKGGRADAERDLAEREKRVAALDIRPLTAAERERYTNDWHETKSLFVDSPAESVLRADRTLADMMKTRGFPMGDFDRRYEDLTVDHGDVARHYREGHALTVKQHEGTASTEDLRQAIRHYEELFNELVRDADTDGDGRPDAAHDRVAMTHSDTVVTGDTDMPRDTVVTDDSDTVRPTVPARPRS